MARKKKAEIRVWPYWAFGILLTLALFSMAGCTEEEKEAFKDAVVNRAKCEAAKAAHKEKIVSDDWYASAVAKCKAAGINI